ncbi:MAG: aminotransferase class I/II-fold pyridoxal phosphate-dependent enzyme [Acetobacter sp.]|jgi:8-amino-7-oxononanoate synthase|nr:aminotransferase class I/II-fold pyridoxal phosphate-dependent enzyme [Acetobacter sp.]MCH4062532.1 aminotransferase class I/II-fold pyridoxal phosphate-dependent enzyme [Acetobacter sp.]MCH4088622.1 aminotransferase class I/II-fold pyridoxal phosphate-dependent enzyme [Acetobacter sp.]MCI1292528.1 aminotransferase class I/II-fold pyridoxal phosphate-dependent enzyme [Acetobacter sp.]MCI1319374.1 aminotransferase class I/II-fold pyridoxal phosphate-dependent enzyme [Acetobacter sp.]
MTQFDTLFEQALSALAREDRRRRLRAVDGEGPAQFRRSDGSLLTDFSSNDYLGLSRHPLLAERSAEWGCKAGTGSGSSRLVTGTRSLHERVEAKIAALKGKEAALLFASGWQANASIIPALARLSTEQMGAPALVFSDRLNHASLHHGCAAAGLSQIRFRHNDLTHLETLLEARAGQPGLRLIITESVFSMDGDCADIPALAALAQRHGAFLCVDEAHATGVLGPDGAGLAAGIEGVSLVMGTFSKALGGMGAYVAGSQALCDWLLNAASGFIYSTALPPTVLGAADAALDLLPEMEEQRRLLARRGNWLRERLKEQGWAESGSMTQIVPVMAGEASRALEMAATLERERMLVVAIRPPTVPKGASRLRIALNAVQTEEELERLVQVLGCCAGGAV